MPISYLFPGGVQDYFDKIDKENWSPSLPDVCHRCGKAAGWRRHTWYLRGVLGRGGSFPVENKLGGRIWVPVIKCRGCRKTVALLPSFLRALEALQRNGDWGVRGRGPVGRAFAVLPGTGGLFGPAADGRAVGTRFCRPGARASAFEPAGVGGERSGGAGGCGCWAHGVRRVPGVRSRGCGVRTGRCGVRRSGRRRCRSGDTVRHGCRPSGWSGCYRRGPWRVPGSHGVRPQS